MPEITLKKILVVDDEEIMRSFLADVLTDAGYNTQAASNGRQALDIAKKEQLDLIILDIILPDMGGSAVAASLKENPSTKNIPIIFLSGLINREIGDFPDELTGMQQYIIPKPVDRAYLLKIVEEIFANSISL